MSPDRPLPRLWPLAILGLGIVSCPAQNQPPASTPPLAPAPAPAAQENSPASSQFLSVLAPSQKAAWQQKLTLGPGDTLTFSLYGAPNLTRNEVSIGPDGRISYLQAQDVIASGLTVDELRSTVEARLGQFYQTPRVLITPVAYRSKKYFVLGAVADKGVFTLDRPLTIVEAVARARGLANASTATGGISDLADLSRSFLIRGGKQSQVDFEKLFQEGDLSQNLPLEPNDYLYLAPAARNEVYVLGSVGAPGIAEFNPRTTLISVLNARGGFAPGAYRAKVLVIRGSLHRPETYVVNASDILKGKNPDFLLQRKDIVYVNRNPWFFAGQILDMAVSAYVYGVVVPWTGQYVTPLIGTKPYIPPL